jgi:hypothetical protein
MQAAQLDSLTSSGHLTPEEQELLAWVMSCGQVNFRKRFTSAQDMQAYRKATALEALVCEEGEGACQDEKCFWDMGIGWRLMFVRLLPVVPTAKNLGSGHTKSLLQLF